MKKALACIVFISFALSLHSQKKLTMADMRQKAFHYGSSLRIVNDAFKFDCDCCKTTLLFNADSTYYSMHYCGNTQTLQAGRYDVKNNSLLLTGGSPQIMKTLNEKWKPGAEEPHYFYEDTLTWAHNYNFKALRKKSRWQFTGEGVLLPSTEQYAAVLQQLENDGMVYRLKNNIAKHIDPFEGLTGFSPAQDTIIINRYLKKLNAEIQAEYFDANNKVSEPPSSRYYEGKAHYSPDGEFKIFVFTGEDCGAHCNNSYSSVGQFKSGLLFEAGGGFGDIISIQKVDDDFNYIVVDKSTSGGTVGGSQLYLRIFKADGDSFEADTFTPIAESLFLKRFFYNDQLDYFTLFSPWWAPEEPFIKYDPKLKTITYQYVDSGMDPEMLKEFVPKDKLPSNSEALLITGKFTLRNGVITNFEEKYEKIPN